jgi:ABC-type cobalamin/Fe3+-siderophores transport system ATPase subunit
VLTDPRKSAMGMSLATRQFRNPVGYRMIERLYVQNFRCLESVTLDFTGETSALLLGRNGAGKSTSVFALKILQSICRGSSRVDDLISPRDFSFSQTTRPMRFELQATLTGKRFLYAVSFDWPENFREARILDENLSVDGQTVFTRQQAQVELANGSRFGLDWHVFALPVINETPPARSIQELKSFIASLVLLQPIPSRMTGFSDHTTTELMEDGSNFASCLRGLFEKKPAAYGAFDEFVRTVIPDFSAIENVERGKDGKQSMVTFTRSTLEESLAIEFDSLSDGEKCFFLCGYIVASTAAGFPIVCVWDEPDNHLSIAEIGQFIMTLRKAAKRGGQFIATSHHPETVRKFSDDTTIVLTRKSHLDPTIPKRLADITYSGDLIDALIRDEIVG